MIAILECMNSYLDGREVTIKINAWYYNCLDNRYFLNFLAQTLAVLFEAMAETQSGPALSFAGFYDQGCSLLCCLSFTRMDHLSSYSYSITTMFQNFSYCSFAFD